jgi:hypothetical protein
MLTLLRQHRLDSSQACLDFQILPLDIEAASASLTLSVPRVCSEALP